MKKHNAYTRIRKAMQAIKHDLLVLIKSNNRSDYGYVFRIPTHHSWYTAAQRLEEKGLIVMVPTRFCKSWKYSGYWATSIITNDLSHFTQDILNAAGRKQKAFQQFILK